MNDDKKKLQEESLDLDLEKFEFEDEEEFEDEYEFTPKKKPTKLILMIAIPVLLVLSIWFFFFRGSTLTPDMTEWSRYEVDNWSSANEVDIIYNYEYSEVAENYVLTQSVPFGTKVKTGLQITVTLSEGYDPNESIEVINIQDATDSEIQSWIEANNLKNIELKYTYNPLVPENHVVSFEYETGSENDFTRKDSLVIEISRGAASNEDKVSLPDLVELSLGGALTWGEINGITINVNYVFSQYTVMDKIISQDVEEGIKVSSADIVNLTVSKGPQIIVPDFSSLTKSRALAWAVENGATLVIEDEYSSQTMNGYYISQSLQENEIVSQKDEITVTYSLGKIDVFSYVGQPVLTMKNAMDDLNLMGANIVYEIVYVFTPSYANGMIITHSYEYEEMSPGAIMTILVSKGESVFVPDFSGLSKELILQECSDLGITCVFTFRHYPASEGTVISQSINDGEVISKDEPVTIEISLGNS